ncbi:glycosyltransferase [Achromobacter sp. NPDC058515]|uniref:glycosyltransferase n=1 Tax=Achromobacter sp. NPDC058515 TaxID=3346533 RepID=UPI003660B204
MSLKSIGAFANFGIHGGGVLGSPGRPPSIPATPYWSAGLDQYITEKGFSKAVLIGAFSPGAQTVPASVHALGGSADLKAPPMSWMLDNWTGQVDALVRSHAAPATAWIVSASLLAQLSDPRPLLLALKRLSLDEACPILFVVEKELGNAQAWTARQFSDFLEKSGFLLHRRTTADEAMLIEASIEREAYGRYLEAQGFSAGLLEADQLLLTTEDATVRATGGIGTYVKNIKAVDPRSCALMCDVDLSPAGLDGRTFVPRMFFEGIGRDSFFDGLGLLEAVKGILYLLPRITTVESQDYKSIGFRVVQAKRTGVLPQWLRIRIFMHGSIDYVKYGVQNETSMDYTPHELAWAVRDSYLFKHADECYAPSRYLGERLLQQEFGYELNNLSITKLPFDLALVPPAQTTSFKKVKRIVFIGKYNQLKGWPDFVTAMESLAAEGYLRDVSEVVSLGPLSPGNEDRKRLDAICSYKDLHLTHEQLLAFVHERLSDTLFVVPSRGENYPFVILEQLLLGSLFVAYNTGGAIEVVDDPQHVERFFSAPDAVSLAKKIGEVLRMSPQEYGADLNASRERTRARQISINEGWSRSGQPSRSPDRRAFAIVPECDVSVVVPVFNTPTDYVEELLLSIRHSRLKPTELIVIDDGSAPDYHAGLRDLIDRVIGGTIAVRLHRQENRGLAGARNAGLELSGSPLTFFIDSDDILLPHTLDEAWAAMSLDASLVAATGFALHFTELKSLPKSAEPLLDGWFWKPLGVPEAKALALLENQYITANVMVRTARLRELGGWDDSDRSVWEDWAFFARLAWSGQRFSLIPSLGYLYRNTPGSMSKTYNKYFGRRRLVRNLAGFSRLDANILFSLANTDGGKGGAQLAGASLSEKEIELINLIRSMIQKPRLRRMIVAVYRGYTRVRRLFR